MKKIFLLLLLLSSLYSCDFQGKGGTTRIIFDTDIGPGYDDVGALTILHGYEKNKECKILATVANNRYEGIVATLDLYNNYWGKDKMAIGRAVDTAPLIEPADGWVYPILKKYPHTINHNQEVEDAVTLYRRLLSIQPNRSVTIVSAGFLSNLSALLDSPSDKYSPLSGRDLVDKKVKELVCMGGEFPTGREYNLYNDLSASVNVIENWPRPIIFSGASVGEAIKTGMPLVNNKGITESPVKDAYQIAFEANEDMNEGYWSWDQTAVLVGVKGIEPFFEEHQGRMIFHKDGSNSWDEKGIGHSYLTLAQSPDIIAVYLDSLMMIQP